MLAPAVDAGGLMLLHGSAIDDPAYARVGYDVVAIDDTAIQGFLDANVRPFSVYAVSVGETFSMGPAGAGNTEAQAAHADWFAGLPGGPAISVRTAETSVPGLWLHAVVREQDFFQPVEAMFGRLAWVLATAAGFILALGLWALQPLVRALLNEEHLDRMSRTDGLTGLASRSDLIETIERSRLAHGRAEQEFTVVLVDVDRFEQINDAHGHAAGDEALRTLGRLCRLVTRDGDL
ncbi:MAG: GGDEF domain-containing protein, partial [Pseudomonadota bacterium]